jgi:hypothetical protein
MCAGCDRQPQNFLAFILALDYTRASRHQPAVGKGSSSKPRLARAALRKSVYR